MGVLMYMINRDETPEFKLPWMALFLLVPGTGKNVESDLSDPGRESKAGG